MKKQMMMKSLLKKPLLTGIVLTAMLFLGACSKSSTHDPAPDPTNQEKFPLTNFTVTVTKTQNDVGTTSSLYRFDYTIKNVSTTDFVSGQPSRIKLRFKITDTEGNSYEYDGFVSDLKAGLSYVSFYSIDYAAGKTIDESKNKVELHYE